MESIQIEVAQGKFTSAKETRLAGHIPMNCYSNGEASTLYTVDYQQFRRVFNKAGRSSIITLTMDGKDVQDVIVQEVQYAPVSDDMIHIDLKAIKKGQKITTDVPLVFVGESAAVREQGGVFMANKDKIHVECLPQDLPHEIEVDISPLVDFHISITVGDIKVSEKITILDAADIGVATVIAPREVEEETAAPEAPVTEITGEKKVEGAEEPKK